MFGKTRKMGLLARELYAARKKRGNDYARVLGADELARDVVVDLDANAGRGVTVVVRPNKVHLARRHRHQARDLVRALLYRGASGTLWDVVLVRVAANARVPSVPGTVHNTSSCNRLDGVGVEFR